MKRISCTTVAALGLGPVIALGMSGCGVGAALQNMSNPKFSDISLVTPANAVSLPVLQAPSAMSGTTSGTASASAASASITPQGPVATVSPAVQQTIMSDLSGGRLTSVDTSISLTVAGDSSGGAAPGTHVGVVMSVQPLSASQLWAFVNNPSAAGVTGAGQAGNSAQGAVMGGTITLPQPGEYTFGPVNPHTAGVTYAGDLANPASLNPSVQASGFDGLNSAALASDFQSLITAANGAPISVYVIPYADSTSPTRQITISGLTISGQAHVKLL